MECDTFNVYHLNIRGALSLFKASVPIYFLIKLSAGMAMEIVMVEKAQEAERRRPVRVSRRKRFLRIEGEAVSLVHANGPRRRVIDDALQVQAGMEGIFFKETQGLRDLLHDLRLTT